MSKKRRPPNVPMHDKTRDHARPTAFELRGIVKQKPARDAKHSQRVRLPQTRRGR